GVELDDRSVQLRLQAAGKVEPLGASDDDVNGAGGEERLGVEDHQLLLDADRQRTAEVGVQLLAADSVHGTARRLPRVVRRARPERGLVRDDAGIAADLLRSAGMTEEVGIVALLPNEHEMRGGHELGDIRASRRRARERVGADTEPARMLAVLFALPELFVFDRLRLFDGMHVAASDLLPLHPRKGSGAHARKRTAASPPSAPRSRTQPGESA